MPTRRHRIEERLAITDAIGDYYLEAGAVTHEMVLDVAVRAGRSLKQARRMIDEWIEVQANGMPERRRRLPEEFLVKLAEMNGSAAAAIRAHWPSEADQKRYRSSVYRWLDETDVGTLMALKGGREAWDRLLEIGVHETRRRNELWLMDEMHIPIRVRGPRGTVLDNLHLISVFDDFSRLCLNAQVTVGPSDADNAAAVLARAIAGGSVAGVEYGGSASALGMDNALIFRGESMATVLRLGNIPPQYARPYTPTDKAKQERWHRTLQQKWLSAFPAYLDGPKRRVYLEVADPDRPGRTKRVRTEVPLHVPDDPAALPDLDEVTQAIYGVIFDYNVNHVLSTIGQTPIARYGSDRRPLARPGIAAFWDVAMPTDKETYAGERRGVHVHGEWRKNPDRPLVGHDVVVRHLPGLDPRYLARSVTHGFLTELTVAADESPDARIARHARNRTRMERFERVSTVARQNVLARVAIPGTEAYVSDRRAAQVEAQASPTLASVDAALSVPERRMPA